MAAARAKKERPPPGPDDLVRESAGAYRSGDERFRVEKSDVGWYLIDNEQANEFGQQLIHGPLPTLDAVREQMPGARSAIATIPRRLSQLVSSNSDCARSWTRNRRRTASARSLLSAKWRGSWALAPRPSNGRRRAGRSSRFVTGTSCHGRESSPSNESE
jgi:hypothetical protein